MELGYACINETLKENKITTNRGMIKKTFMDKGLPYVGELALQNIKDLFQVIQWNEENGISFYRMSSDLFPWHSEYELPELPQFAEIAKIAQQIGEFVKQHNHRLTFHPGPFNTLASPKQSAVAGAFKDLSQHANIMDLLHLPQTNYSKMNIHIGGKYDSKTDAMKRWVAAFNLLPENVRKRLTVENDDKGSMYSVKDLMYIHEQTGIPIVYDYLHDYCHSFDNGVEPDHQSNLELAMSTWPSGITPIVHFASSRKIYEDESSKRLSHADYIHEYVDAFGNDVDIMFECKAKERAVLKYKVEFHRDLILS